MSLRVLVAAHLVRYPLGGHCWHHLQYLIGLQRLGHRVTFYEDYGWPNSCYDPPHDAMTADPSYGLEFVRALFARYGFTGRWTFLAEDGTVHGMPRAELAQECRECDVFINLSNLNWIDELRECRRRVVVDTDPVFTQIGAVGMGGELNDYHVRFTYGENVHKPFCTMPTANLRWLPTRQPVLLDTWPVEPVKPDGLFTTVTNLSAYGDHAHNGATYRQKDHEFERFIHLPQKSKARFVLALNASAQTIQRVREQGWQVISPLEVTRSADAYQRFIQRSLGEWCVAKQGYVVTNCGWFSDRSCGYLASGRPVVVQDTGFSRFLPIGKGLFAFNTAEEAIRGIDAVLSDPSGHSAAARRIAEEHFDASKVLVRLLEQAV